MFRVSIKKGFWIIICAIALCFGCKTKSIQQPQTAQEMFQASQRALQQSEYETAIEYYEQAVSKEPALADQDYRRKITYGLAIKLISDKDEHKRILQAQNEVMQNPTAVASRRKLVSVAVDRNKDTITVFGLGLPPKDAKEAQAKLLAQRGARVDTYRWIAHIARWIQQPEASISELSGRVKGAREVKKYPLRHQAVLVKVEAPLSANLP